MKLTLQDVVQFLDLSESMFKQPKNPKAIFSATLRRLY